MKNLYNTESNCVRVNYRMCQDPRLNKIIKNTTVFFDKGVSGQFDFRDEQYLSVCGDVSNSQLVFNSKATKLSLCVVGLNGDYDFSGVHMLYLDHSDVSQANITFNQNARFIDLFRTAGLQGYFDFSNVQELKLGEDNEQNCASIANVSGIKFNPNGVVRGISNAQRQRLESGYKQYELVQKQLKHNKRITNEK